MAFKLTKAEDARKDELEVKLTELVGGIEDAKTTLMEDIDKLVEAFNEEYIRPFNEVLTEARGFVEDIGNERRGQFDDKSENWQDGERGQSADEWTSMWENAVSDLEDMGEVASPEITNDIEIPDAANTLMELPMEAE